MRDVAFTLEKLSLKNENCVCTAKWLAFTLEISNLYGFNVNPYKKMKAGLGLDKFLYIFILNPYKFSQWASEVLWTSNGRLYEV